MALILNYVLLQYPVTWVLSKEESLPFSFFLMLLLLSILIEM